MIKTFELSLTEGGRKSFKFILGWAISLNGDPLQKLRSYKLEKMLFLINYELFIYLFTCFF